MFQEAAMAEDRTLPGWPRKKLIKDVRRQLSSYGIRPSRSSCLQATWAWAAAIARSYYHEHWLLASEIATQYILLMLADVQNLGMLKLAYRACEVVPAEVVALLPRLKNHPLVTAVTGSRERKRTGNRRARPSDPTVALDGPMVQRK
jgi:hypothetical protein